MCFVKRWYELGGGLCKAHNAETYRMLDCQWKDDCENVVTYDAVLQLRPKLIKLLTCDYPDCQATIDLKDRLKTTCDDLEDHIRADRLPRHQVKKTMRQLKAAGDSLAEAESIRSAHGALFPEKEPQAARVKPFDSARAVARSRRWFTDEEKTDLRHMREVQHLSFQEIRDQDPRFADRTDETLCTTLSTIRRKERKAKENNEDD